MLQTTFRGGGEGVAPSARVVDRLHLNQIGRDLVVVGGLGSGSTEDVAKNDGPGRRRRSSVMEAELLQQMKTRVLTPAGHDDSIIAPTIGYATATRSKFRT